MSTNIIIAMILASTGLLLVGEWCRYLKMTVWANVFFSLAIGSAVLFSAMLSTLVQR